MSYSSSGGGLNLICRLFQTVSELKTYICSQYVEMEHTLAEKRRNLLRYTPKPRSHALNDVIMHKTHYSREGNVLAAEAWTGWAAYGRGAWGGAIPPPNLCFCANTQSLQARNTIAPVVEFSRYRTLFAHALHAMHWMPFIAYRTGRTRDTWQHWLRERSEKDAHHARHVRYGGM